MNKIDLEGRVAVVTGGAQGIGYAIAERMLASGASVSLWDADAAKLAEAKGTLGNGHYEDVDSMFADVFADLPWHLAEQQGAARAEAK